MEKWTQYKLKGDIETRNELIVEYVDVVKKVAKQMASGLPPFVNEEDLFSYGTFGLIDAIEKFDPERGYKFETYAVQRIRGAIYDELRVLDWAPRSVRAKTNAIDKLVTTSDHGMPMTEREAAAFLGMSDAEFNKFKTDEYGAFLSSWDVSMSDGLKGDSDALSIADVIADQTLDGSTMIEYDHMRNKLVKAINLMPERERMLTYLYYYEQMTLADIGKLMKVTESRVCQIHTSICANLKNVLQF